MTGAGMSVVDVRWLADVHARLLVRGQGPRRVPVGGTYLEWGEVLAHLSSLTGRRLPRLLPCPRAVTVGFGRASDFLRRSTGIDLPFAAELGRFAYSSGLTNQTLAVALAGPPPDVDVTLRDAIRWLCESGHLPPQLGGVLSAHAEHVE